MQIGHVRRVRIPGLCIFVITIMIFLGALLSCLLLLSQSIPVAYASLHRPLFGLRGGEDESGIGLERLLLRVVPISQAEESRALYWNGEGGYLSLELDASCVLHMEARNFDAIVEVISDERPYSREVIGLMASQGRLVNRRVESVWDGDQLFLSLPTKGQPWPVTLSGSLFSPRPVLTPIPLLFTQTLSFEYGACLVNYTPERIMIDGYFLALDLAISPTGALLIQEKFPRALEILILRGELGTVDVWISGISLWPGDVLIAVIRGEGCICLPELTRQLNSFHRDLQAVQDTLDSYLKGCVHFYLMTRIQAAE